MKNEEYIEKETEILDMTYLKKYKSTQKNVKYSIFLRIICKLLHFFITFY